eukprot:TRINITY_DN29341_c0_g1_i1.p1 TRINITY_DN29341_c0_g1~~TRINITY_DN29341_c0_g1_i1.p1  ORF type:complete len:795 (+),score=171.96 TRINITY_DN29341_c0_g1_i1:172-2556(+)
MRAVIDLPQAQPQDGKESRGDDGSTGDARLSNVCDLSPRWLDSGGVVTPAATDVAVAASSPRVEEPKWYMVQRTPKCGLQVRPGGVYSDVQLRGMCRGEGAKLSKLASCLSNRSIFTEVTASPLSAVAERRQRLQARESQQRKGVASSPSMSSSARSRKRSHSDLKVIDNDGGQTVEPEPALVGVDSATQLWPAESSSHMPRLWELHLRVNELDSIADEEVAVTSELRERYMAFERAAAERLTDLSSWECREKEALQERCAMEGQTHETLLDASRARKRRADERATSLVQRLCEEMEAARISGDEAVDGIECREARCERAEEAFATVITEELREAEALVAKTEHDVDSRVEGILETALEVITRQTSESEAAEFSVYRNFTRLQEERDRVVVAASHEVAAARADHASLSEAMALDAFEKATAWQSRMNASEALIARAKERREEVAVRSAHAAREAAMVLARVQREEEDTCQLALQRFATSEEAAADLVMQAQIEGREAALSAEVRIGSELQTLRDVRHEEANALQRLSHRADSLKLSAAISAEDITARLRAIQHRVTRTQTEIEATIASTKAKGHEEMLKGAETLQAIVHHATLSKKRISDEAAEHAAFADELELAENHIRSKLTVFEENISRSIESRRELDGLTLKAEAECKIIELRACEEEAGCSQDMRKVEELLSDECHHEAELQDCSVASSLERIGVAEARTAALTSLKDEIRETEIASLETLRISERSELRDHSMRIEAADHALKRATTTLRPRFPLPPQSLVLPTSPREMRLSGLSSPNSLGDAFMSLR